MEGGAVSVYGINITQEMIDKNREKHFEYLKACIKAERLNPEADYESLRLVVMLKDIAKADLTTVQRSTLIQFLEKELGI